MAISLLEHGDVVALGYDSATGERGFLCKMVNRTGHTSVKGELIAGSPSADKEAVLQSSEFDTIGIVQEASVVEGSEMWVWMPGSICQVLFKNSTASTRGNVALAADTDGRAIDVAVPSSNPVVAEHFKEIGHVLETKSSGTNVLVLVATHYN